MSRLKGWSSAAAENCKEFSKPLKKAVKRKTLKAGRPFILFWHLVHLLHKVKNYKKQLRKVSPIFSRQITICICCLMRSCFAVCKFAHFDFTIFFEFNFFTLSMHVTAYCAIRLRHNINLFSWWFMKKVVQYIILLSLKSIFS